MRGNGSGNATLIDQRRKHATAFLGVVILFSGVVTLTGCGGDSGTPSPAPPAPPPQAAAPAPQSPTQPEEAESNVVESEVGNPRDVDAEAAAGEVTQAPDVEPTVETAETGTAAPAGESPFEMSYLDPATELFVFARPSAIVSSPMIQALSGGKLGPLNDLKEKFGIGIDQIESVTIGVSDLKGIAEQSAAQMAASMQQAPGGQLLPTNAMPVPMPSTVEMSDRAVVVIRTSAPVSLEDLQLPQGDDTIKTHASQSYHQLTESDEPSPHLYQADETTFVVATEHVIQATIDRGGEPSYATADLSFIPTASHVLVAVVPQDRDAFFAQFQSASPEAIEEAQPSAPVIQPGTLSLSGRDEDDDDRGKGKGNKKGKDEDEAEAAAQAQAEAQDAAAPGTMADTKWRDLMATHAQSCALLVDLDADLKVTLTTHCDLPASAVRLQKEFNVAVDNGKQMYEVFRGTLPGLVQEIAQSMIDSIAVNAGGEEVSISTTLPESQQANLTMLPMVMMGMMLSQTGTVEAIQPMVDWQERAQQVLDAGELSVLTDGVPEGLEIRGLVRWALPEPGREFAHPRLELAVVGTGGPAAHVSAFGRLKVTEARVTTDVPLKWMGVSKNGRTEDPLREVVVVDHEAAFSPHPPKGLSTGFTFHPPLGDAKTLELVTGEIVMEAPTTLREVTLSSIFGDQTTIEDADLQAANFSVETETVDGQIVVRARYDEMAPLGKSTVLDASGNSVQASTESQKIKSGTLHREWRIPDGVKQPLGLTVVVLENMQEVTVPFRFEDLPMPEPPGQFVGQTELLSWTTGNEVEEFPEGLTLQAQARWKAPQSAMMEMPSPVMESQESLDALSTLKLMQREDDDRSSADTPPVTIGGGSLSRREEKERERGKGKGRDDGDAAPRIQFGDDDDDQQEPVRAVEAERVAPADSLEGRLQFVVDLVGPITEATVAVGDLQVEKAAADGGLDLEFEGGQFGLFDVTNDLAEVARDDLPTTDQPPDGLRVVYKFTRPTGPIKTINEFKGTLHLRTVEERIEAVSPNLSSRINKRIRDRKLAQSGIEFAVDITGNSLKYRTLKGEEKRLAKFFPVDADGDRIEGVSHQTTSDNGNLIHVFQFSESIPDDVGMKFIVNVGVKEIDVPVEFSDVPVPTAPTQVALGK
ncbi:MAG: hypothetical protein KDA93_09155 [Planctomycetaceae bacterium]|nr:hypothetical protein [Planctomycetaceae bacterium]